MKPEDVRIEESWRRVLAAEFEKPYFTELAGFVRSAYTAGRCYPPARLIFNAFDRTPFDKVKVVILGQDPYHEPGQAHGLCFSVQKGTQIPPSLQNIYKELKSDLGIEPPSHGYLESWARQGVLLLNTTLTVRRGQANSHRGRGWDIFTDAIIRHLNEAKQPIAFILWGRNARDKKALITNPIHGIFESPHPSPLSAHAGFFGSRPFSRVNEFLSSRGLSPIDWRIPEEPID